MMMGKLSASTLAARPGWDSLRAMKEQRLCVFSDDERDILVRPGPRMAEGARLMVKCLEAKAPRK